VTSDRPAPRPALRRADDGSVHPASPRLSSLAVDAESLAATVKRAGKGKGKTVSRGKGGKPDERVELVVAVPRSIRKELRRKAEAHGWTAEEAAAHVLRAWVDG
jgi:hypothetical protein